MTDEPKEPRAPTHARAADAAPDRRDPSGASQAAAWNGPEGEMSGAPEPSPLPAGQSAAATADTERPDSDAPGAPDTPQHSERDIAQEMRLDRRHPKVVRMSPRVLMGMAGAGALALSGTLFWALTKPHRPTPPPELVNTDTRQTSEALDSLPRDYAGIHRLGPPLPGDLGRPMVAAGVGPSTSPPPITAAPARPESRAQAREQARLRLAQEREAARSAQLFAAQQRVAPVETTVAAPAPNPTASESPASTDSRRAFLAGSGDRQTIASDRLGAPPSPYLLQAGAVIPAALITGLRSDLPGQITAQVTGNVYDSPTGQILLIPQGSRLIGEYDAGTRFGQRRALLVWTRLILPNGRSMLLDRQPGADADGAAGLADRVNNHWGQILRSALVSMVLSIGTEAGTNADENELLRALRHGGSDGVSQVGQQLVGRSLNIQPTIAIRPGHPVRVIVTRDLVLEPGKEEQRP